MLHRWVGHDDVMLHQWVGHDDVMLHRWVGHSRPIPTSITHYDGDLMTEMWTRPLFSRVGLPCIPGSTSRSLGSESTLMLTRNVLMSRVVPM